MTHAVILAAGTGSRFGDQRLLALLDAYRDVDSPTDLNPA
jgi:CTP:molybdopterin cytidylyltransferase MocA